MPLQVSPCLTTTPPEVILQVTSAGFPSLGEAAFVASAPTRSTPVVTVDSRANRPFFVLDVVMMIGFD